MVIVRHDNNQFNLYLSEEMGVHFYQSLSDLTVLQSDQGRLIALDLESVGVVWL